MNRRMSIASNLSSNILFSQVIERIFSDIQSQSEVDRLKRSLESIDDDVDTFLWLSIIRT